MPRQVALALCLAFIASLLVRDFRRRPSFGVGIWLPMVLVFVLASRPVTMWFGLHGAVINDENYLEGSPVDRMFYLLLIVSAGVVATYRGVKWSRLFAANAVLIAFYLFFAASVFWAADPMGSFKRLFKDFGLVIVAAVILSEKDPMEAIRAVYVRCACILIPLSVLFIKYYPELGRFYSRSGGATFTGVAMQKNSLGELVMVFGLFLIWDYLELRTSAPEARRRWDYAVLLLMGLWLLNISESKTALMCLIIGTLLILRGRRFASTAMNRTVLIGVLAMPFFVFFSQSTTMMEPIVQALGRDMTFTGRREIWQTVLAQDLDPILGNGFWNFWGKRGPAAAIMESIGTENIPSAHNGYLDLYIDGGLVALGLLFCLLLTKGLALSKGLSSSRYQRVRFAVLIMSILYNLSESMYFRLSPIWFTTVLMFIGAVTFRTQAENVGTETIANPMMPLPSPVLYRSRNR